MTFRSAKAICRAILYASALAATTSHASTNESVKKSFVVFNALNYVNTPDLRTAGFHDIKVIYEATLTAPPIPGRKEREFSSSKLIVAASSLANTQSLVSLDIESWNINAGSLEKYERSIQTFKQNSPKSTVGLYGFFPFANALLYKFYEEGNPLLLVRWEVKQNSASKIAELADVNMPSLYTWGPDATAWEKTAKLAIQKARDANPNKPIYAFVWPQYHDSYKPHAREFLSARMWRAELETLYQIADGVIIWSSSKDAHKQPIQFSKDMPWFKETLSFMKERNIH